MRTYVVICLLLSTMACSKDEPDNSAAGCEPTGCLCDDGTQGLTSCEFDECDCGTENYAACELDPASTDSAEAMCAQIELESCAARLGQCNGGYCARKEGSSPYCTQVCTTDGDCGSGRCEELGTQTGVFLCTNR